MAHDPDRSMFYILSAFSIKFYSALANPFIIANLGLAGKFSSLII